MCGWVTSLESVFIKIGRVSGLGRGGGQSSIALLEYLSAL